MKLIYYVNFPLAWAKGGVTIQIMETKRGLEKLGIEVSWLHHEDLTGSRADIIHYWGRPPSDEHWQLAKKQGCKIVASIQNAQAVLRPEWTWKAKRAAGPFLRKIMGAGLYANLGIGFHAESDALLVLNPYEGEYVERVFEAPHSIVHVVPNGVDSIFFDKSIAPVDFDGLVYNAYVRDIKNTVEVARAAKQQGVRVKFIGGIHSEDVAYGRAFKEEIDNQYVFWEGEVTDRARMAALIRGARGSFIAGQYEAQSISILESLACGVPVMMSNFKNLQSFYGGHIAYCHPATDARFPGELKDFYQQCAGGLKQRFNVLTWDDVAKQVAQIYKSILTK